MKAPRCRITSGTPAQRTRAGAVIQSVPIRYGRILLPLLLVGSGANGWSPDGRRSTAPAENGSHEVNHSPATPAIALVEPVRVKPLSTTGEALATDWADGAAMTGPWPRASNTLVSQRPVVQYCLLYTSPSPRDRTRSRMPSSA